MHIVTVSELRALNACEPQIKLFERVFPQGASLTKENLAIAHASQLGILWYAAAVTGSSEPIWQAYDVAWKRLIASQDCAQFDQDIINIVWEVLSNANHAPQR